MAWGQSQAPLPYPSFLPSYWLSQLKPKNTLLENGKDPGTESQTWEAHAPSSGVERSGGPGAGSRSPSSLGLSPSSRGPPCWKGPRMSGSMKKWTVKPICLLSNIFNYHQDDEQQHKLITTWVFTRCWHPATHLTSLLSFILGTILWAWFYYFSPFIDETLWLSERSNIFSKSTQLLNSRAVFQVHGLHSRWLDFWNR